MAATPIPENRAVLGRATILRATGGEASGPRFDEVTGVVTDSRSVRPGNLFVALRGEHFDAHDFAAKAFDDGAAAVLVEHGAELPDHVSAVRVDDTLRALGDLARAYRDGWNGDLIAITGSVGKTTTKTLLAAALRSAGRKVLATTGNLNNRVGVPMTLFLLDDSVDTAVVEMGTSEAGEIARLAEIGRADASIVTRASAAHTEGLGSVEAVADEKVSLLQALDKDGLAIAYGDDQPVRKRAAVVQARRKLFYGRGASNDVRVLDWEVHERGTRAHYQVRGQEIEVDMGLIGEGAVLNGAAALAVSFGLGVPLEDAARGLVDVDPPGGRVQPRAGVGERLIIDDSYNASPASVEVALATAAVIAERRDAPLVVILGDMLELGAQSETSHREVGERIAEIRPFLFVGCGHLIHEAVDVANGRGIDTLWFEDAGDCAEIEDRLPLRAVVLVKGSRGTKMERVIEPLLAERES